MKYGLTIAVYVVNQQRKILAALATIALSSTAMPSTASAQDADAEYQKMCDWLTQQSTADLQGFIKQNLNDPCVEIAAQLIAERSQPEAGVRAPLASGRY